jgi:hypothetical protein
MLLTLTQREVLHWAIGIPITVALLGLLLFY